MAVEGEGLFGHGAGVVAVADGPLACEAELGGAERRATAGNVGRVSMLSAAAPH